MYHKFNVALVDTVSTLHSCKICIILNSTKMRKFQIVIILLITSTKRLYL